MKKFILIFCVLITIISCEQEANKIKKVAPVFSYLLDKTDSIKLFMPSVVSKRNVVHFNSSFSDDGKHLVYTIPDKAVIQTFAKGTFSKPKILVNDTIYSYGDPHISSDGNKIIISSNRPFSDNDTIQQSSLWEINRTNEAWSKPKRIKIDMGFEGGFSFPSLTKNGVLYFAYMPDNGSRNMDIYRVEPTKDGYGKPEKLPTHINTDKFEGDPFIDREERFLIFAGFDREENYGLSDLYITFKQENGWSDAINLGKEINSHGYDGSAYVTTDDHFLIFTSSRHPEDENEQELFNVFYTSFDYEKYKKPLNN